MDLNYLTYNLKCVKPDKTGTLMMSRDLFIIHDLMSYGINIHYKTPTLKCSKSYISTSLNTNNLVSKTIFSYV